MAGAITLTYDDGPDGSGVYPRIHRVIGNFTTDSSGDASVTTRRICGELIKIVTDPGATAPSANWDVVITDENGLNPLAGIQNAAALLARHTSNTEQTYLQLLDSGTVALARFPIVCGELTLAVANGGATKIGQITIYYRI